MHTINQFFGKAFSPEEARDFIDTEQADLTIEHPETFEEQALRYAGSKLYEAFLKGYTQKQWGCSPSMLPASILKRLPVRFSYDDNYFSHQYQGMPRDVYTTIVRQILNHAHITVHQQAMLSEYIALAGRETNISFVGRLDTYRYLDMDVTIAEALDAAALFLSLRDQGKPIPTFFVVPV